LPKFYGGGQMNSFDLVFIDPPYDMGFVEPTIDQLIDNKLLSDNAIIIAETEKGFAFTNNSFEILDHRTQSNSTLWFLMI